MKERGVVSFRSFFYPDPVKLFFTRKGESTGGAWVSKTGVNFINILRAAFMLADPKSAKKLLDLTVFFELLGSARLIAAKRMLTKLTPGVKLIKTLHLQLLSYFE